MSSQTVPNREVVRTFWRQFDLKASKRVRMDNFLKNLKITVKLSPEFSPSRKQVPHLQDRLLWSSEDLKAVWLYKVVRKAREKREMENVVANDKSWARIKFKIIFGCLLRRWKKVVSIRMLYVNHNINRSTIR